MRAERTQEDKFYQRIEKELERKQSILSALKKILQSMEEGTKKGKSITHSQKRMRK